MAVFRIEKNKDFTIMSNHHLRNKLLSLKAKGLQSLMLSLPEMWDYSLKGLAKICKDGVDSIGTALQELEQQGYLTRRQIRDDKGKYLDLEYTIHEIPVQPGNYPVDNSRPKPGSPDWDYPEPENPDTDEPDSGKRLQLSINSNKDTQKLILIYQTSINQSALTRPMRWMRLMFTEKFSKKISRMTIFVVSYMLTTLYNAPGTMDNYYKSRVNHDFYGSDKRAANRG